MSRIRPLSYIEPSGGTVAPGSVLTLVRGSRGLIGQWNAPVAEAVLDTQGTPLSVADMARAYNQLVWDFSRLGIVSAEPRMWFGDAGYGGVKFVVNGTKIIDPYYIPYVSLDYMPTQALTDVLDTINANIDNSNVLLTYEGGRVTLIVKSGTTLGLTSPSNLVYDSGLRIMRRLFGRTDISDEYVGPAIVVGNLLAGPIAGIYPVPNSVTEISGTDTNDGFLISWTPVSQPAGITTVQYVVYAEYTGETLILGPTSDTSILAPELIPGNTYLVSVITFTDYEASTERQMIPLTPGGGPPPIIPTFTLSTMIEAIPITIGDASVSDAYKISFDNLNSDVIPNFWPGTNWVEFIIESADMNIPPYNYTILASGSTQNAGSPPIGSDQLTTYEIDNNEKVVYLADPSFPVRVKARYYYSDEFQNIVITDFSPYQTITTAAPTVTLFETPELTTSTGFTIGWDTWTYNFNSAYNNYYIKVVIAPQGGGISQDSSDNVIAGGLPFSDLISGTTYDVSGYILYKDPTNGDVVREVATLAPITVTTQPSGPPPLPTDFTIIPGGSYYDTVTVSWDGPQQAEGITVNLTGNYSYAFIINQLTPASVPLSAGTYTYTGLPRLAWPYTITAVATNGVDTTNSSSVTINTLDAPTPSDAYADNITSTSFRLVWAPPSDTVVFPTLVVTMVRNGAVIGTNDLDSSLGEYTYTNLDPNTSYTPNFYYRSKYGGFGNGFSITVNTPL